MVKKIDYSKYKQAEVLIDVIGGRLDLKKNGREFEACCPFHDEKTPSFTVVPEKGYYYCFGCEAKGDALDFIMDYDNVDNKTARQIIDGGPTLSESTALTRRSSIRAVVDDYAGIEILPVPIDQTLTAGKRTPKLFNPKRRDDPDRKFTSYTPSMVFEYRSLAGDLMGYVLRIDFDDKKITPVITWCKLPDGTHGWCHKSFDDPRPLYGQEFLENSLKPVCVVEGEKAADAADKLLGDKYDVISWSGGSSAPAKSDWSPMNGKDVLLWSDMDLSGVKAMRGYEKNGSYKKGVGDLCADAGAASIKVITLDETKEKGWDAADALAEEWTWEMVMAWAKKFVRPFTKNEYDCEPPPHLQEAPPAEFYMDEHNRDYGDNVVPISASIEDINYEEFLLYKPNKDKEVEPKSSHNAIIFMRYHTEMKGVLAYNENNHSIDIVTSPPWGDSSGVIPRAITDSDSVNAKAWLEQQSMKLTINDVKGAIVSVADKRRYNPLKTFINELKWDGVPRLHNWLTPYMGVKETEYSRLVGRRFMIGAIARGLKPGCKMDTMLILEGKQGVKKSTAIEVLFGKKFFTDEIHQIGSKDASMQMQGKWVIEIAEMHAMNRSETNQIKEWIVRTVDRFRPPYASAVIDSPRSCVLVGTLNPEGGYLKDATGARRFLPVMCHEVDIKGLHADREQLWAEAKHEMLDGKIWWYETGSHEAGMIAHEQEDRYEGDSWSDDIDKFLFALNEVTIPQIQGIALDLHKSQWNKASEMRVGKHLHHRGWYRKRATRDGVRQYVFLRG